MLLTNHDLHDLHAVFVILRAHPSDPGSEAAIKAVKAIIDAPQTDNTVPPNILRSGLSAISSLDRNVWYFIDTQNLYTYGTSVIKDEQTYAILSACLVEMLTALAEGSPERVSDLADALHNVPIILAEGKRNRPRAVKRDITREISYCYRSKWNKDFLKALL